MRRKLLAALGLSSMLAAFHIAGCGGPGANCDAKCDCERCSEAEFNACVNAADSDANNADFRGCTAQYDDLLSCEDATGACVGFEWKTSCGPEHDAYKNCIDPGKPGKH